MLQSFSSKIVFPIAGPSFLFSDTRLEITLSFRYLVIAHKSFAIAEKPQNCSDGGLRGAGPHHAAQHCHLAWLPGKKFNELSPVEESGGICKTGFNWG